MRGGTEKANLLSIAPTPFAENQMNAQAEALPQPKRAVQHLGLQSRRLAAIGRKLARLSEESLQRFHQPFHCDLSFTAIFMTCGCLIHLAVRALAIGCSLVVRQTVSLQTMWVVPCDRENHWPVEKM